MVFPPGKRMSLSVEIESLREASMLSDSPFSAVEVPLLVPVGALFSLVSPFPGLDRAQGAFFTLFSGDQEDFIAGVFDTQEGGPAGKLTEAPTVVVF